MKEDKKKEEELDLFDWDPILIEGEDYYMEGSFKIFTASYLVRRGKCCGNDCRHCPYGFKAKKKSGRQ